MKKILTVLVMALWSLGAAGTALPVQSIPQLDVDRYMGRWYEIARYPMFFQRHCLGNTSAEYQREADGRVSVFNRCRTASGWTDIRGHARVVADSGNARLKVTFFWPFSADYWVIGIDPAYQWAVVGTPDRDYLWILARNPTLTAEQQEAARAAAAAQGFDLAKLIETPQSTPDSP